MNRRNLLNAAFSVPFMGPLGMAVAANSGVKAHPLYKYWPKQTPRTFEEYVGQFMLANYNFYLRERSICVNPTVATSRVFGTNVQELIEYCGKNWRVMCKLMADNIVFCINDGSIDRGQMGVDTNVFNFWRLRYADLLYSNLDKKNLFYKDPPYWKGDDGTYPDLWLDCFSLWKSNSNASFYEKYYERGYHPLSGLVLAPFVVTLTFAMFKADGDRLYDQYVNDFLNDPLNKLKGNTKHIDYWSFIHKKSAIKFTTIHSLQGNVCYSNSNVCINMDRINRKYKSSIVDNFGEYLYKYSTGMLKEWSYN